MDESPDLPTHENTKVVNLNDSARYHLHLAYKDPFLKASAHAQSATQVLNAAPARPKSEAEPKAQVVTPAKPLPDIKYLGLIKNNSSGKVMALVSVNGQSTLLKENESLEGIQFKTFSKDSLVAKWGKQRLVLRK